MSDTTQLRLELQHNPVFDEVSAITAITRPILKGVLYSLKQEVVAHEGGQKNVPLFMLPRLYKKGDGDIGICFEYAVHEAITSNNPLIIGRIYDALKSCKLGGGKPSSILFGAEKSGSLNLIETTENLLTDDSLLLYGSKGRPVKLKPHIRSIAASFRKPKERGLLPQSISGLWKADLFTGNSDTDKWIGTTLKINRSQLEGAKGLRLGIVPSRQGESDKIVKDEHRNLIICPLPYDQSFMEMFYEAWQVVQQFFAHDAKLPKEVSLPRPASRQVAKYLADRRGFKVHEVIEALEPLSQPHLLDTQERSLNVVETRDVTQGTTSALLAPMPQETNN